MNEKANRDKMLNLVAVSRMYYEDSMNQNQIAKVLGVSRPLVSKYLAEAKDLGIVEIKINSPFENDNNIFEQLKKQFNLQGGQLIKGVNSISMTEQMIVKSSFEFIKNNLKKGDSVGISWGNMIGDVVKMMDNAGISLAGNVCSLVGNSATANKNYHTDEICRAFSSATGMDPHFILAPAFFENKEELDYVKGFKTYLQIEKIWNNLSFAILNIENHPSVPDLATASRFGKKLKDAVGHMVSYYYDINGNIIASKDDLVCRIGLEELKKVDVVIGVCRCNVTAINLLGALNAGILTHVFVDEKIALETIQLKNKI